MAAGSRHVVSVLLGVQWSVPVRRGKVVNPSRMPRHRDFAVMQCAAAALVGGFLLLTFTNAEEECLSGKAYWCYECDSWSDPRCRDPFNWTALPSELPTLKQCDGCCVKIVMNAKQPNEEIRRTCTKNIQINLFMVDHVCMYEGHKTGHMCFCEGDSCNTGTATAASLMLTVAAATLLIL